MKNSNLREIDGEMFIVNACLGCGRKYATSLQTIPAMPKGNTAEFACDSFDCACGQENVTPVVYHVTAAA